jgi:GST-like protein
MPDLSSFPITQRWPASHPDRLQLYAAPTPNGVKVSIMLEETGLAYEPHLIDISNNESKDPAFVSLNPNGRIPAIIDPAGPDGRPIALWESGAILLYLADKTGQFISTEPGQRYETLAWVFFQMSAIGPMFGQLGFSCDLPARTMRTSDLGSALLMNPGVFSGSWITGWRAANGLSMITRSRTLRRLAG